MRKRDLPPIHPGEQLREEFMKPLGLSAYRLAKDIAVPISRIQAIIDEKRAVTGDTALRLARYFGNTPEFWLNVQRRSDLWEVMHSPRERRRIERARPLTSVA